jgi:hypothetical protein
VHAFQLGAPFAEHGTMNGRAEAGSGPWRQRRWYSGMHTG